MPGHRCMQNGPEPDPEFLRLVHTAAEENKNDMRAFPTGQEYIVVETTPVHQAVIRYFIDNIYPKFKTPILDPAIHRLRWKGSFLHQHTLPGHPKRALIVLPLMVTENLQAEGDISLEVGRPIYLDEDTPLELVGSGMLLSINLGFSK